MVFHILNGDALVNEFKATGLSGEIVVTRECLIEGDLSGESLEDFYKQRSAFLSTDSSHTAYFNQTVPEFEKIINASSPSEFNLWFGYDLFCQTNLWFVLSLLHTIHHSPSVYLIYPIHLSEKDRWLEFGSCTVSDLLWCHAAKTELHPDDLRFGAQLWQAYKHHQLDRLSALATQPQRINPYLKEVVQAHLDRFPSDGTLGRPQRRIKEISDSGIFSFYPLFTEFSKTEGVYGFGDQQIKNIIGHVIP